MSYTERVIVAESDKFHISNVKLYEYLDEARSEWYKYCIFVGVESVLVHIRADFKKEIFPKDRLRIRTWLEKIGNTSFTLMQTVVNQRNELVVSAEVVLATIDCQKRTKVTVPDEVRILKDDLSKLDLNLLNNVKNP